MYIYILEIKRFLKENKKYLIIGTLFLSVLFSGAITLLNQTDIEEEQETGIEDSLEVFENDSRSAYFRFYIEKVDGSSFSNAATLNELFNMEELYEKVLTETNIDIKEIIEFAEDKEFIDFSPIKVKINGDSNIYTAIFETGDNSDNISLANYYYSYLFDRQFNMLEKHTVYSLVEPELVEDTEEKEKDTEEKEKDTKVVQSKKSNFEWIKNIIINLVIGFILSVVLVIGILLLKELFGNKLNYFFGYDAEEFDDFILYDQKLNNGKTIQYFLGLPYSANKLILIESGINQEQKNLLFDNSNPNFDISNSIDKTSTSKIYDEIILIVKVNETTRRWYNEQKKLINLHEAKTKIIQLNNNYDIKG